MNTKTISISEDVWGAIRFYDMPYPDVYFVSGMRNEGYVVPRDYGGNILSPKALSFGKEGEGLLFFASGETMSVVEYELLQYRLAHSYHQKEKEFLAEQINDCRQFGQVDLPGYFGEYPPPHETPLGIVERFSKVCNGVYFAQAGGQWQLAICYPIWHTELTIPAQQFGQGNKDYYFFDLVSGAIPIFELSDTYPEIRELAASEEAMRALLCQSFAAYVEEYNINLSPSQQPLSSEIVCENELDYLNFPGK